MGTSVLKIQNLSWHLFLSNPVCTLTNHGVSWCEYCQKAAIVFDVCQQIVKIVKLLQRLKMFKRIHPFSHVSVGLACIHRAPTCCDSDKLGSMNQMLWLSLPHLGCPLTNTHTALIQGANNERHACNSGWCKKWLKWLKWPVT